MGSPASDFRGVFVDLDNIFYTCKTMNEFEAIDVDAIEEFLEILNDIEEKIEKIKLSFWAWKNE